MVMVVVMLKYMEFNWDLFNIFFTSCDYNQEIVWLISSYVLYVWENIFVRGAEVKL